LEKSFVKVSDLSPTSKGVNLKVKVVGKTEPREVVSRKDGSIHRVAEAIVGDETGIILMTLWDTRIDEVEIGDVLEIVNAFVTLYRGSMRLNVGRYGTIIKLEGEDIEEVNEENNLSAMRFPEHRGFPTKIGRGGGKTPGRGVKKPRRSVPGRRRRP